MIYAHLQERPPAVSASLPRLPAGLDAVLGRAMAKKPADRYSSCREFVLAAEAALADPGERRGRGRRPVVLAAAGLVLVAALTAGLVLSFGGRGRSTPPRAAAAPVGYGVSLSEQLSTGAPGAQPDLTLLAVLDDGHGVLHGLGSGPPPQTGEISFRIDRRQLEPDTGESGVYGLLSDPTGTQIGYFSASPPGDDRVQEPLRKVGVSRDAKSGDSIVRLAQPISPAFRRLAGESTFPVTVRIGSRELIFTFNAQKLARAAVAAGISYSVSWFSLHLFGSYQRFGGQPTQLVRNPDAAQDVPCIRLGKGVRQPNVYDARPDRARFRADRAAEALDRESASAGALRTAGPFSRHGYPRRLRHCRLRTPAGHRASVHHGERPASSRLRAAVSAGPAQAHRAANENRSRWHVVVRAAPSVGDVDRWARSAAAGACRIRPLRRGGVLGQTDLGALAARRRLVFGACGVA